MTAELKIEISAELQAEVDAAGDAYAKRWPKKFPSVHPSLIGDPSAAVKCLQLMRNAVERGKPLTQAETDRILSVGDVESVGGKRIRRVKAEVLQP